MGKTTRGLAGSFGVLIAVIGFAAPALAWSTPVWIRQPGTPGFDYALDATTDVDGNIYVVGQTEGSLFGRYQGSIDGWLAKFDATGHKVWAQQIGKDRYEGASGVATDADGNIYVVGWLDDGNVAKFDAAGHRLWAQRIDGYPSKVATAKGGNAFIGSFIFDGEYGVSVTKARRRERCPVDAGVTPRGSVLRLRHGDRRGGKCLCRGEHRYFGGRL